MKLSEAGEARVRGYLFILSRSLLSFMPRDMVHDSVREVESHILERVAQIAGAPDERAALEQVLAKLGEPMKVAQAYAAEITFDEAVATGRPLPVFRALWHVSTSVRGFLAALALSVGYSLGATFLLLAVLKPIFPRNIGLVLRNGIPVALGGVFPITPGTEVIGGYALIPLFLLGGVVSMSLTNRLARKFVGWWRSRMKGAVQD